MKYPQYNYCSDEQKLIFTFESVGPRGVIKKIVEFSHTNNPTVFTMALGDYDPSLNGLNDSIVSDNRDIGKVFSTVAAIVYAFTDKHPYAEIFITGSTMSRNRLYRMIFANYNATFSADFAIFGHIASGDWERFQEQKEYNGFSIIRTTNHYFT
ncbi:DUF6934 family protein [Dyadobacter sandarakinus]|uniref:Uncharacterized protein n=1 Tax=Dyadobacter sandarakinus TaxID=2747268 RepID=A0ABX7I8D3_9BACT|nr:hypothetical protein [Dyadobacter sandarakinus]QRR02359.1 hypothetical protein HWI92_16300 [Dyadobacter sandarakinus]